MSSPPLDPCECLLCARDGNEQCIHVCSECNGRQVELLYNDEYDSISALPCSCPNGGRMLYETPCGLIYDGNAQCNCDECFMYYTAEIDNDDDPSDTEHTPSPRIHIPTVRREYRSSGEVVTHIDNRRFVFRFSQLPVASVQ